MAERNSGHERDPYEWYVEPTNCVHTLFNVVEFVGEIHDPCCGLGTIPRAARERGYVATGADIVDRSGGEFPVRNFFNDKGPYDAVCTNPPFRDAEALIQHAKRIVRPGGIIAVIGQAKFLYSQGRIDLFEDCERVIILSRRPSMPPGKALVEQGEAIRGGGSLDYCWCIWRAGVNGPTKCQIEWAL